MNVLQMPIKFKLKNKTSTLIDIKRPFYKQDYSYWNTSRGGGIECQW